VGVPLHPTQLYHAGANLMIFIVLFAWRRRKRFDGQLFWGYVLLYAIGRTIIEVFRGDFRGPRLGGLLSISQAIAVAMALLAVFMLRWLSRRARSG
jgi:phosphatidylglycerol:prolipoprotein diacylglycerol transferase